MISSLVSKFSKNFSEHPLHIVHNLFVLSAGIFKARTPNLWKVKDKLGPLLSNESTTQSESNYYRLIRFFRYESKEELIPCLLCVVFYLLRKRGGVKYLVLDGTSWAYGQKHIHLLTLSVVYNGVSIPIWWEELEKKGVSNLQERQGVIRDAEKIFDLRGMVLLADREYMGRLWFKWLKDRGIDFVIRLKGGAYKEEVDAASVGKGAHQKWRYRALERRALMPKYRQGGVSKTINILGLSFTFVIYANPKIGAKESLIYFLSSLKKRNKIIRAYPIRWTIESCFKQLKSNGFRIEELNFKCPQKIKLMMAIIVFLYAIALDEGWKELTKKKKSHWKKYADGKIYLAISVFRKGLPMIENAFTKIEQFLEFILAKFSPKNRPRWLHV